MPSAATSCRPVFATLLLVAAGAGSACAEDRLAFANRPADESPFYEHSTHPREAAALGLVPEGGTATYVAPQVFDPAVSEAHQPVVPLGYQDAGLPPTVQPTFTPYASQPVVERSEWHLLPGDPLFRTFIASVHAPRMSGEVVNDDDQGTLLDVSIGGRIPILRKGTLGPQAQGWELQVYGAALTRLSMDRQSDVEATDYK
ncbi:MAG: hypothetical protein M3552_04650, partial [Planctomycetota bacterium]|nr:hypothetical protein [Planctomycetota bacterium]